MFIGVHDKCFSSYNPYIRFENGRQLSVLIQFFPNNEKTKMNKVKTVVYLFHFLMDMCARSGVLHIS